MYHKHSQESKLNLRIETTLACLSIALASHLAVVFLVPTAPQGMSRLLIWEPDATPPPLGRWSRGSWDVLLVLRRTLGTRPLVNERCTYTCVQKYACISYVICSTYTTSYMYTHIYIYVYMYICIYRYICIL